MFGRRYFGARFFAPRFFGDGGGGEPPPIVNDSGRRGGVSGVVGGVLSDPEVGPTEARR